MIHSSTIFDQQINQYQ